jgi:Sulfotransferase family
VDDNTSNSMPSNTMFASPTAISSNRIISSPQGIALIALVLAWISINMHAQSAYLHLSSIDVEELNSTRIAPISSKSSRVVSAHDFVQQAYKRSFSVLESCSFNKTFRACIGGQQQILAATANQTTLPWWFYTMMRDAMPKDGQADLFGYWHNLSIVSPRIDMCAIEKIGCKHWRRVQCNLNFPNKTAEDGQPCIARRQIEASQERASSIVFLRDPLERFLSGFLDKCVRARRIEPHCQPLEVFAQSPRLVEGIINSRRHFFEAYVDAIPFKWDMHFFPQSFYCDGLYRHIQNYDFVGHMGPNFYRQVKGLGEQLGDEKLVNALETVFQLTKNLEQEEGNMGVETSASSHVEEYYTAATVRRVLEYYAIDYVLLDIQIPGWAQRLLIEDS